MVDRLNAINLSVSNSVLRVGWLIDNARGSFDNLF